MPGFGTQGDTNADLTGDKQELINKYFALSDDSVYDLVQMYANGS